MFRNLLKRILASHTVRVYWQGLQREHYAKSEADALEWLAAYPQDAVGFVFRNLTGAIIASRGPQRGIA